MIGPGGAAGALSVGRNRFGAGNVVSAAELVRGAGANIPDGGTGWSRWFELDVTQPDQTILNSSLSTISGGVDPGGKWETPSAAGTGGYFDEALDGHRTMRLRWGTDETTAGRFQGITISSSPTEYYAVYIRMLVAFSDDQQWASNTAKLLIFDHGNWTLNASGLTPPRKWLIGNLHKGGTVTEKKTLSTHGATEDLAFTDIELECQIETTEDGDDGVVDGWIDGTRITDWDNGPSTRPGDFTYAASTDFGGYGGTEDLKWLPYLGGSPSEAITTPFDIYFACLSIWVKEEGSAV